MSQNNNRTEGSQGDLTTIPSRNPKHPKSGTKQPHQTFSQRGQSGTDKSRQKQKSKQKESALGHKNSVVGRKKSTKRRQSSKEKEKDVKMKRIRRTRQELSISKDRVKADGKKQRVRKTDGKQKRVGLTDEKQKRVRKTDVKQKRIRKSKSIKTTRRKTRQARHPEADRQEGKDSGLDLKSLLYSEQQEKGQAQSDKQCPRNTDEDKEVKQQVLETISQQEQRVRQSHLAKRLHAFRDELQIRQIESQGVKSRYSSSIKHENDSPTEEEIRQLLQLLREKEPKRDHAAVLEMLYRCLIKKDSKGNDCRSIQEELLKANSDAANEEYCKLVKNLEGNLRAVADRSQKTEARQLAGVCKGQSRREDNNYKFSQKQVVARAFCNREFGVGPLLQQIRQSGAKVNIDKNLYKTLVIAVLNEGYRRLQEFLSEECGREIERLSREEMRAIESTLLGCRLNFDNEQCLTFLKFLKLAYQLESVTITDEAAMELYVVIQRALKLRLGEMQLDRMYDTMRCNKEFKARRSFQNEKFQIHRVWSNEIESEFLSCYKQNQEFAKIRDYFTSKYRDQQHLYTIDSLRSRFNKIMRMALRKTSCFCEKFGQERVPHMIKLNDKKAKYLLKSPKALNARLLLVDMYIHDECDIRRLYQTVSAVNEFVIMKDNERMNRMLQAEPLFNSATAKIHHNVTVTKHSLHKRRLNHPPQHQIYYKGREMNYDHIVQKANGHSLHYYRKPNPAQPLPDLTPLPLKLEDQLTTSVATREATAPSMVANRENYDWMEKSSCLSREEEGRPVEGEQTLERMIREEMQKYHKRLASSSYR